MTPSKYLNPDALACLRELKRRRSLDVFRDLYPLQRTIAADPHRFKTWLAGARTGKTYTAIRILYKAAIDNPGTTHLYLGLSRPSAKRLAWGPMLDLCEERQHLMPFRAQHVDLNIKLANGSNIWISGAPDVRTIERFRGIPFKTIVIDEAASYGDYLGYLVKEVFGPRLEDYAGSMILIGTPSGACTGLFYDATTGVKPGWKNYHSTILNNPMFPRWAGALDWQDRAKAFLREIMVRDGIDETSGYFRREWMAEWVPTQDDLLHHIPADCWIDRGSIPSDLALLLGIDMGFGDKTAFVITGYGQYEPGFYEVDSMAESRLSLTEIVTHANSLVERYHPEQIVIDPAAGGMHLVSELSQRYSIPVHPSDKSHKATWIEFLQDDFANGRAHLLAGGETGEQARILRWNALRTREREGQPCDCYDGYLYTYRHAYHWIHKERPRELSPEEKIEMQLQAESKVDPIDWY